MLSWTLPDIKVDFCIEKIFFDVAGHYHSNRRYGVKTYSLIFYHLPIIPYDQ